MLFFKFRPFHRAILRGRECNKILSVLPSERRWDLILGFFTLVDINQGSNPGHELESSGRVVRGPKKGHATNKCRYLLSLLYGAKYPCNNCRAARAACQFASKCRSLDCQPTSPNFNTAVPSRIRGMTRGPVCFVQINTRSSFGRAASTQRQTQEKMDQRVDHISQISQSAIPGHANSA